MIKKRLEFSSTVKNDVRKRAKNRCERCGIDFDEEFVGEFHHIIPLVYGGENTVDNCSLLCRVCHYAAPNVKTKQDLIIYRHYFLRFASFKEAAEHYGVDTRVELHLKIAKDIAQKIQCDS